MSQYQFRKFTSISAVSTGANITGDSFSIQDNDNIGIQISWDGTTAGTFSVEVSNDNSTWDALTLSSTPTASGSAGSWSININQAPFQYMRIKFTRTSGTGTATAIVSMKGV